MDLMIGAHLKTDTSQEMVIVIEFWHVAVGRNWVPTEPQKAGDF